MTGKDITVITPTLASREGYLQECMDSVSKQTMPPLVHLVGLDSKQEGDAVMRNRLLSMATTDWIATLDDDDLMLPDHLEALVRAANAWDADIVYPNCRLVELQGDGSWAPLSRYWKVHEFDLEEVRKSNYIPITALIRRQLLVDLGGFRSMAHEDKDLWVRAGEKGARFRFVPKVTWIYRWHKGSETLGGVRF